MGNYELLKAAINEVIKANGRQEITGEVLNQVLLSMVNSLGAGYQCMGVATPSTNPGTPDQNVFYFATQAGTYTNFDAIVLQAGISVLIWDGDWASQTWFTIDSTPTNNSQNIIASGAVFNALKLDGGAYDVSAHNSGATFASLSELLNSANLNTLIPTEIRHGGMSIKFVQSSDNNYKRFDLIADEFTTDVTKWQGVDDVPTDRSNNLVKSGGVYEEIESQLILTKTLPGYSRLSDDELNLNGYIDSSGNINTSYVSWMHSDFKKIKGGTKLYANGFNGGGNAFFAFYTSNDENTLIATLDGSTGNMVVLDVPQNAEYFRASGYIGIEPHYNEIYYAQDGNDKLGSYILDKVEKDSTSAKSISDDIIKTLLFKNNISYQITLLNTEFKYNGFIKTDGTVGVAGGWLYTDFIKTNPGGIFKGLLAYAPGTAVIAFYSSDNVASFIGYAEINLDVETTAIAPINTQYFRVSTNFSLQPNSYLEYSTVGYASKTVAQLVKDVEVLKQKSTLGILSTFKNKKVAIIGDSISNGQFSAKSWGTILNEDCGFASLQNLSINGATLNNIYSNELPSLVPDLDVIFVAGGANDFLNESEQTIGQPFQMDTNGKRTLTTDTTIYGTLNRICLYLRQHYPSALIILIAPLKVCLSATASGQVNSAYDKSKSGNFYFEDMIEAFRKISLIHSIPLFDACSDGILNSMVSEMAEIYYTHQWSDSGGMYADWGRDLTHPTTEGHKVLARYIKGELLKYIFLFET